jgi:cytochrome c-type biogenesis protein CcmH/NrfF
MADSEFSGSTAKEDRPTWLRALLWAAVGIALVVGLVLFFRYTRHMTPLL